MTRFEEKLYLQSVFNAIDQVYKMKNTQQISSYEERLRTSFNKLLIPDWYNHEYTSTNGLRKTKSHGHVPRTKRTNYYDTTTTINNNHNDEIFVSSSINSSNNQHRPSYRHRSPSRSWSEKLPFRRDSMTSSYDTNGSVINGRRSATLNGSSTYTSGVQRVAQSSTWYKPRIFTTTNKNDNTNRYSIEPPKPLPRYSKIDRERLIPSDSSLLPSKIVHIQYPLKPCTMAQVPTPSEESSRDESFEVDLTVVEKSPTDESIKILAPPPQSIIVDNIGITTKTDIPRTNSWKSVSSESESYRSANWPSTDKNLFVTDSLSCASVDERCLSPSSASYHTARVGDTSSSSSSSSSIIGYETPTPQLNDDHGTLSSHSSLSDLSHAETLEPNTEDLDIATISIAEQKSVTIPSVDVETENSPITSLTSTSSNIDSLTTIDSHASDVSNWYDGSKETCIHQPALNQNESFDIREISNDEELREVDMNAVGDEFYLFLPHSTTDNEQSHSLNDNQLNKPIEFSLQTPKRIFTMDDKNSNNPIDFYYSSSTDPFDFDTNTTSIMITNLDDILNNDNSTNHFSNTNYRRPIHEDILYEVEHENSCSDHSQNTSSMMVTNDQTTITCNQNTDFLTVTENPIINITQQTSTIENSKGTSFPLSTATTIDNNVLPIYILPPLYTTSTSFEPSSSSLHIDTNDNFHQYNSSIPQSSESLSPSVYTPKIRYRQYSVGSYYDNKTKIVGLTPNYFLGSAPVSPLNRISTSSNESHYYQRSPSSYDNLSSDPLRHVNPFYELNTYSSSISNNNQRQIKDYPSTLSNREQTFTNSITYSVEQTIRVEPASIQSQPIISSPSTRATSVTFSQYEIPITRPKPVHEFALSPLPRPTTRLNSTEQEPLANQQNHTDQTSMSPSYLSQLESVSTFVRPNQGQEQIHESPSLTRTKLSEDKLTTPNIYQEIGSALTNFNQNRTINDDIEFIRGTIERVFRFRDDSFTDLPSDECNQHYEEVFDADLSKAKKKSAQYPAVEAVQRFYKYKTLSNSDKRTPNQQITNLDDIVISKSSTSKTSHTTSSKINARQKNLSKYERTSSDEVDDTLNDVDEHDGRFKRQIINNHTSNESSPLLSSNRRSQQKETQITGEPRSFIPTIETRSNSINRSIRTTVSPIDIVTEMVIEQDNVDDEVDELSDDMIVFCDDIEIVEHCRSTCSSETDSTSTSLSNHYSKPANGNIIKSALPPPVPTRTSKPVHLIDQHRQKSPLAMNHTCELGKALIRKKFDVNSVNDILNRTEYNIESSVTHRHPSARHFVGKLNNDDSLTWNSPSKSTFMNRDKRLPTNNPFATLPSRSSTNIPSNEKPRSIIADTNALVKYIQNSLSRNSLHDTEINSRNLSSSTKDLRTFVSLTYSPSNENVIDDKKIIHTAKQTDKREDQTFKRQARLSKSFHDVSEYYQTNQCMTNENNSTTITQPSKSVDDSLNQFSQNQIKPSTIPFKLTSIVVPTSSSALTSTDENPRMLSMKWYTGQVNENSEISYNTHLIDADDLLYGYISTHSNSETQVLLTRLQASNDPHVHKVLDDIRTRVAQFDTSKTREDLHVFMRYLESRLRSLNNKISSSKQVSTDKSINGYQQSSNAAEPDRIHSVTNETNQEIPPTHQLDRQRLRSSGNNESGTNMQQVASRRSSQLNANQENSAVFDEMLNTVLGLSTLPSTYPLKQEKSFPLTKTQMTTNATSTNKNGRETCKRLFESGTYEDPRLIYDGPKKIEKEKEPLETSV